MEKSKDRVADSSNGPNNQPGWSLGRWFYTDPRAFEIDMARVFMRQWLCAGHASRIRHPGEYFTFEFANESLIIIRGEDQEVHALSNVCRHRGSRICTQDSGQAKKLVCPYHQWVYDAEGRLLHARLMPPEFDRDPFGLRRAFCRVAEGLIFVSFSEQPPDFFPFEEQIIPRLKPHGLARTKICHTLTYHIKANWKVVLENSRECYHCGRGHPQYCRAVGFAAAIESPEIAARELAHAAETQELFQGQGIDPAPVEFQPDTWYHSRRFLLRNGHVTESMDGNAVAPLLGSVAVREVGVLAVVTLPNLLLEVNSDYAMLLRVAPVSPLVTRVDMDWLVREDAVEGEDYGLTRVTDFWKLTAEQDWKLCEDNQAGINSVCYRPGPYSPVETGVTHFIHWYLSQVGSLEMGGGENHEQRTYY